MNYLSDYVHEAQTTAFGKAGAFFAFSQAQFYEKRKPGVNYVGLGLGMFCPKATYKQLMQELHDITAGGIRQDVAENGKSGIILRELYNQEAFYVGEIDDTVEALEDYGFSREEVQRVYRENQETAEAES